MGSGNGVAGEPAYDAMVEVGRLLAERGCIVVTGGFGGAGMEAPVRGAREAGGKVFGYTMLGKPANEYLAEYGDCQFFGETRLPIELQFGTRLGHLLESDGFIICAGGGPGTMVELIAIINLNIKLWKEHPKRFAILMPKDMKCEGWGNGMIEQLISWGILPLGLAHRQILITGSPEAAVGWVTI